VFRAVKRALGSWLLYRLVRMLEDSVTRDVLAGWCEYSSADAALMMPYVHLGFSSSALIITVVINCKWLMRRFAPHDTEITSRLIRATMHHRPRNSTNCCESSIHHDLLKYQQT